MRVPGGTGTSSADQSRADLRRVGVVLTGLFGALLLCLLGLALGSAPASGKAHDVRPGKNAIQKAVDQARPGDVLRLRGGRYKEDVVIDKRLKVWGPGEKRPTIDGRCQTHLTVAVTHAGVVLKHLKVVGAADGFEPHPSQVDFRFLGRGTVNDLLVRETCGPEAPGEYGINLLGTRRVNVRNSVAKGGHTDAGIYLGAITGTGKGSTVVRNNESFDNTVGIIVEQSFGDIQILDNHVYRNNVPGAQDPGGIFVNIASGVLFARNTVTDNADYGVRLTPMADNNVLNGNVISGNATDLENGGTGNCGSGNTIGAGPGLPAC